MRLLLIIMIAVMLVMPCFAADEPGKPDTSKPEASKPVEKTVTLDAKDMPISDVIKSVKEQTGANVLAEKLVTGNVTVSVKDATVEKALGLIARAAGVTWTKVYVPASSVYVKDADALATQMRLLLGLKFPDIIVAPTASYSPVVHLQKDASASDFIKKMGKDSGMEPVYLITNDKAYTKKTLSEESKAKSKKYADMTREMMDLFMSMTPEERAEAMKQGMLMTTQMGPEAMMEMMNSVMQMDPQYMSDMNSKAMQAMMNMDPAQRKNFLKTSMRSQFNMIQNMDPTQMQQFQKETAEIMKELIESGEVTMPPGGAPAP